MLFRKCPEFNASTFQVKKRGWRWAEGRPVNNTVETTKLPILQPATKYPSGCAFLINSTVHFPTNVRASSLFVILKTNFFSAIQKSLSLSGLLFSILPVTSYTITMLGFTADFFRQLHLPWKRYPWHSHHELLRSSQGRTPLTHKSKKPVNLG